MFRVSFHLIGQLFDQSGASQHDLFLVALSEHTLTLSDISQPVEADWTQSSPNELFR